MFKWPTRTTSQEADLKKDMTDLPVLKKNLEKVKEMTDPFDQLLYFFQSVSPWQDRFMDRCRSTAYRDPESLSSLEVLFLHLYRSGRGGMNRTKPGEIITPDDIWLGNIYGLFTKNMRHWDQYRFSDAKQDQDSFQITQNQARDFVGSHLTPLIDLIDQICTDLQIDMQYEEEEIY